MPVDTSGNALNIWPEPLNLDEYEDFGFVENEDEDAKDEESASAKSQTNTDEMDEIATQLDDIAEGKSNEPSNKVVKGLQKVVSRKDREIDALKAQNNQLLARMDAFEADTGNKFEALNESTVWSGNTLLDALDEDARKEAELDLRTRAVNLQQKQVQRSQQRPPQQQQQQAAQPQAWEVELQTAIKQEAEAYLEGKRDFAVLYGVKPDNPLLDFGDETMTFNQRDKRFAASLKKAQEAELDTRTKKVTGNPVNTRGANGGGDAPPPKNGASLLEVGSRGRSAEMRKIFNLQ